MDENFATCEKFRKFRKFSFGKLIFWIFWNFWIFWILGQTSENSENSDFLPRAGPKLNFLKNSEIIFGPESQNSPKFRNFRKFRNLRSVLNFLNFLNFQGGGQKPTYIEFLSVFFAANNWASALSGFSRRKVNIFWDRDFPYRAQDILAPQPEAKNWPSEEDA